MGCVSQVGPVVLNRDPNPARSTAAPMFVFRRAASAGTMGTGWGIAYAPIRQSMDSVVSAGQIGWWCVEEWAAEVIVADNDGNGSGQDGACRTWKVFCGAGRMN